MFLLQKNINHVKFFLKNSFKSFCTGVVKSRKAKTKVLIFFKKSPCWYIHKYINQMTHQTPPTIIHRTCSISVMSYNLTKEPMISCATDTEAYMNHRVFFLFWKIPVPPPKWQQPPPFGRQDEHHLWCHLWRGGGGGGWWIRCWWSYYLLLYFSTFTTV